MLLFAKPMPPKIRKKRTRTGCAACKEARKKCCEQEPQCTRCVEKGLKCLYNPVKPRRKAREQPPQPPNHPMTTNDIDSPENNYSTEKLGDECVAKASEVLPAELVVSSETSNWPSSCSQFDVSDIDEHLDLFEQFNCGSGSETSPRLADSFHSRATSSQSETTGMPSILELSYPDLSTITNRVEDRKLLHHFCTVLSHLIVFTEEPINLFQRFILPLAADDSPVLHAICAFSKGHLEYMGVQDSNHSTNFRVLAAEGVFDLVQKNCRFEEVLAATMLLVYYESLTLTGSTNMVLQHLQSAFFVLSSMPKSEKTQSVVFLERAFHFYDVITALSLAAAPVSAMSISSASDCIPQPRAARNNLGDPLLGMAGDLWPILYRLSSLKQLKEDLESATAASQQARLSVLQTEFEVTARAVDKALQEWAPPVQPRTIDASLGNLSQQPLQAMVHNSLAYRYSALVYLNRSIYRYPLSHPAVQTNCYLSLKSCVAVISSGGPVNALLWPLFVAACEAVTDHDRGLARYAFMEIERRQGMINIERARAVVLYQWASTTMGNSNGIDNATVDAWRNIAGDMGLTIIFG